MTPADFKDKPWAQLPRETSKQFHSFVSYLNMGKARSIRKAMDLAGASPGNERTWERWSSENDWVARAQAYDSDHLMEGLRQRTEQREAVRQMVYDRAANLLGTVLGISEGRMPPGDSEVLLGRDGSPKLVTIKGSDGNPVEVAATRPLVAPNVRLRACEFLLGLAGLVESKKVQIEGSEGDDVRLQIRGIVSNLDPEIKAGLVALLGLHRGE